MNFLNEKCITILKIFDSQRNQGTHTDTQRINNSECSAHKKRRHKKNQMLDKLNRCRQREYFPLCASPILAKREHVCEWKVR